MAHVQATIYNMTITMACYLVFNDENYKKKIIPNCSMLHDIYALEMMKHAQTKMVPQML
jgi:hypothetical protein